MVLNPFWGEEDKPDWYHIKATDIDINKEITFWLWGESESDIKNKVLIKGCYKDIQWIKKDTPPFI